MKRVLMVHPSVELYGSDRMLLQAVRAIAGTHSVTTVLPEEGELVELIKAEGSSVRIQRMAVLRRSSLRPYALVALLLASLRTLVTALLLIRRTKPDVVYVSTTTIPVWILAGRLSRTPTVCHVHEAEDDLNRTLARCFYAPLLLAGTVIANSAASARAITTVIPALAARTTLIYNGVPAPARAFSPNVPSPPSPLRLVLVGRLSWRKGSDVAVDAVGLLHQAGVNVQLRLVGDIYPGNEGFHADLLNRCRRWGIVERVEFAGFLESPWSAYDEAHIALVPSRAESFGNVAVEAMLTGRPVIVSDVQGLPEIITDGRTGFIFPSGKPEILAERIMAALDDWDATRVIAGLGKARAHRTFGVESFETALAALLGSMVPAEGHVPPPIRTSL